MKTVLILPPFEKSAVRCDVGMNVALCVHVDKLTNWQIVQYFVHKYYICMLCGDG